jgi:hypothetical protein
MLEFKALNLNDKKLFDSYFALVQFSLSTYSFTNLFMWRDINDIKYAIYDDCLLILKKDFNGYYHFIEPVNINSKNITSIIEILAEYAVKNNFNYLFKEVSWDFAWRIKTLYCNRVILTEERENFDYIYKVSDLIDLKGNKYKSQRNHYNHFIRNKNIRPLRYVMRT